MLNDRLATQDVLATLRQYKLHKRSQHSDTTTTTTSSSSSATAEGGAAPDNVAYRLARRFSRSVSRGSSSLLGLPQQHTSTAVARRAWSILTALREPRLTGRLLVDLFEQAALERELALREDARTQATHVLDDGASKSSSRRRSTTGRVLSRGSRRGSRPPPVAGIVIGGGLPGDLARLIGSFVPNTVQSMVMNV